MLHVSYYAQNYAGIIRQGLFLTKAANYYSFHNYNNQCNTSNGAHNC